MAESDTSKNPPAPTTGTVPAVSSVPPSQSSVQNVGQPAVNGVNGKLQTPWPLIVIIVVVILGGSGWLYVKQFILDPVSGVVSQGVGTASNPDPDADCNAAYGQGVSDAANELAKEGGSVSQAVFYSPSLKYCVGIISSIKGSVTNTGIFNAETREMLNAGDSATALSDYASTFDTSVARPELDSVSDFMGNSTLYTIKDLNISYPNDWSLTSLTSPNDGSPVTASISHPTGDAILTIQYVNTDVRLSYYIAVLKKNSAEASVTIESEVSMSVPRGNNQWQQDGSVPAHLITDSRNRCDKSGRCGVIRGESLYLIHKGIAYAITIGATSQDFDILKPTFKNIIDSVALK